MSQPLADELLAAVDSLPYPERVRLFALRARALAASGGLDPLLGQLRAGDQFRREVGLFLAVVVGHTDAAASFMEDPDWRLRERALEFLARTARLDAAAVAGLLTDAPAHTRRQVYRALRSQRRDDLADALIDHVRLEFGDAEAVALLPACADATVARLLPGLGHQVGNWVTLARRHPQVVLAEAARQLAASAEPGREAWWRRRGDGVLAASVSHPYVVIDLLERFAPGRRLPGALHAYGRLAAADPIRVLALLTAPGRAGWLRQVRLPRALLRRFGRLEPTALVDLARGLRDDERRLAALLQALPPSRRAELYDAAVVGVSRATQRLSSTLLDVLPHPRRIAETRRILELRAVRDDEALTLSYTAHLPWTEAEPVLAAATGRGEPDERALAWAALVECAARGGREAVTAVIDRTRRLRNEQDPVRCRALAMLARVRPWLIVPDTAQTLRQVVTDAVQARDSSSATLLAVSDLAVSVLRHHYDSPPLLAFAQDALQLVYGTDDRMPYLAPLHTRLRRGQEVAFLAAVTPWLHSGIDHGRYEVLFSVAQALGRRGWALDDLQAMLEHAIHHANVSASVRRAISLWLADPSRRSTRVEEVLRFDSSTVALPQVWAVLEGRRTDLLDRVLTGAGPRGRFLADGVRWVPPAGDVRRWLPRQRRSYVDLLAQLAGDAGLVVHSRANAIAAAARAGQSGLAVVRRYVDSPEIRLAEAALAALVWTDDPAQVLPLLLSYVDTGRARVATYAAGRAAAFAQPSRLRDLLAPIATGTGKVTSRKESLRLLARFGGRAAGSLLLAAWSRPDQHRDVRSAVVSVARQRLDSDGAWQVLTEAAAGDRYDTRALAQADPLTVPDQDRRRYAALVVRACGHTDREAARAAWRALPAWTQWTDDLTQLLVGQLVDLADSSRWLSATATLASLVGQGGGGNEFVASVDALLALDADDPSRDDLSLDRPAHRRLTSLVEALLGWSACAAPGAPRAALASAGRRLVEDSSRRYLGARLLVHAVAFDDLDGICDLLLAEPVAVLGVQEVGDELAERIEATPSASPAPVLAAASRLAARGDLPGGLLALALAGRGGQLGWPVPWRSLVRDLRRHPSADVRLAALRVDLAGSNEA